MRALEDGDADAAERLWLRFFDQLVDVARRRLRGRRRVADEEDVALSALDTLFRGAAEGRFSDVADRQELWRLLVKITARKAVDTLRREGRQKRGGGEVRGESVFAGFDARGLDQVLTDAHAEGFLTSLDDVHERLLGILRDDTLRDVARLRMEGYENREIAERMSISLRSVERKLSLIRDTWQRELDRREDA